ncbi:hypothetical protein IMY97_11355 [Pectobacterium versatile]|uniref:hypothetical protein n=1 Tax=Pectobacterium TaxID=122277 RepID=UPI000D00CF39|nr:MULTISPECIES: hypothetical protein [Pectobacterium]MBA0189004.1 hypothetical protein [Pectobacterium odoriferum]MBD0848893.1 hypothetical protein [Pectobacterium carotovorum subsp. carotovorum]MBK4826343.1 hypothetical protein [Pectobacterium carotovorum subsp. carotovorum]MBQ4788086.1 hypothetical protein [Pectobacterium versatile]PRI19400.1 hypothetical protein BZY99_12720 [Pectobacterium versatile]
MTAEIAVYNKTAVALAADSAVTISGGGSEKIYNGAEKLFALSKHHPVGLMVYGSGDLCSAPWELIIKAYRKHIGTRSFSGVEDYANDFFDFLEKSKNIVTELMRDKQTYSYLSDIVLTSLVDSLGKYKGDGYWDNFNQTQFFIDLEEFCHLLLEKLSDTEFLDGFSGDDLDDAHIFCDGLTAHIVSDKLVPEGTNELPDSLVKVVNSVFAAMLCKRSDTGNISGLVIAGYGEDDYYPQVLSYDVCGFFNEKIRKSKNPEKCSSGGDSGVTPFAQEDEVSAFMQGCSSNLIDNLHSEYRTSIGDLLDGIDQIIGEQILDKKVQGIFRQSIIDVVNKTLIENEKNIQRFMHKNYISKVVNMVEYLPKQDLAYMAESLVNLTAFKRKVSDDSETVGGPIDVAVISKADGFIWVKRKHYFSKDLNHHFFAKY